jgi:uncharacterized membrane protein
MMLLRVIISLLCAVGFYASVFMLRKSIRAKHGEVKGPSVVKSPRAKLFAGLPNALFGVVYYAAIAAVTWFAHARIFFILAELAALFAAGTSLYLAYSLLYVTKKQCPYCWTAHAVNWSLALVLPWLV